MYMILSPSAQNVSWYCWAVLVAQGPQALELLHGGHVEVPALDPQGVEGQHN